MFPEPENASPSSPSGVVVSFLADAVAVVLLIAGLVLIAVVKAVWALRAVRAELAPRRLEPGRT
jgi:hypothetical protein